MANPCKLAGEGCSCDGSCLDAQLAVKCTVCKWVGNVREARANKLAKGEKMQMGRVFRCPGCMRRNTSVGEVKVVAGHVQP